MPDLHHLAFDGAILVRGFWLYIWEITAADERTFYYVGKTGDKSSGVSQSPFNRLSAHLGKNKNNNALIRHLGRVGDEGIDPRQCQFRFYACGPLLGGEATKSHGELCDIMSSQEKALADAMLAAGYSLLNTVHCQAPADENLLAEVKAVFAKQFPKLIEPKENDESH